VLAKHNRLVTDNEIKSALSTKHKKFTTEFSYKISSSNDEGFRLLVIVPKKVYKKANKRNLVKRRIISIFEDLKFNNQLPSNVNLIIQVISKDIINLDYIELKDNILSSVINLYQRFLENKDKKPQNFKKKMPK